MDKQHLVRQHKFLNFKYMLYIQFFLLFSFLLFDAFTSLNADGLHLFEAESAKLIAGASKVSDTNASGDFMVSLTNPRDGIRFSNLPAAHKLAIRYASVEVGTISVAVNGQSTRKVNVHSSGDLTSSFLYAILDIAIPAHAALTINITTNDVTLNIDKILIGDGNLGLPSDIWNLSPLTVAAGSYPADWKGLSRICKDIGAWLKINGEAVYGSRPFEVSGENSVCYTRNKGNVYATLLDWNGGSITLKPLYSGSATLGKVSKVELLGSDVQLTFVQNSQGLTVVFNDSVRSLPAIADQPLASKCRVLRVTHDKGWINDDDPGAIAPGWLRRCNLGTGDYNNDLTTSNTPGDIWSCSFTGSSVVVIAPKESGAGKIEVLIDSSTRALEDLSNIGTRQSQQVVCEISSLTSGKHVISIINRGPGPVAVDAIQVQ